MSKSVAVLGLSKFGQSVAAALADEGAQVLVADIDEELVNSFADAVTYAMVADLRDINAIHGLGLGNMDLVIVAISKNIEAAIMCVTVAKELGVPRVIAKAKDDRTGSILLKLGADKIMQPEVEYGERLARTLVRRNFIDFFDLTDDVAIVELTPRASWIGQSLKDLELRNKYGINVLGFKKGKQLDTAIDPNQPLKEHDQIMVLVEKKMLSKVTG